MVENVIENMTKTMNFEKPSYRFELSGGAIVICCEVDFILHPGVKDVICIGMDEFWTGHFHIHAPEIHFSMTEIESVSVRSNLCQSDEDWDCVYDKPNAESKDGYYELWEEAFQKLVKIVSEHSGKPALVIGANEYYVGKQKV